MAFHKQSNLLLTLFYFVLVNIGCSGGGTKSKEFANSDLYNLSDPKVIDLPQELDEISGIAYYAKDTSVFAIVDEDGTLYKISLRDPKSIRKWTFDKKRDFEDLVLIDSTFYVLIANGDVATIKFEGEKIHTSKVKFSDQIATANEFEILYQDNDSLTLNLICKSCEGEDKKSVGRFALTYKDSLPRYKPIPSLDMGVAGERLGVNKHLRPSAAAINPINGDLYVVSSIQKLLVIYDTRGLFKALYKLNPAIYKQPEGITFTPQGDLIISNEFAEDGFGNLLLMKNIKKAK